MARLRDKLAHAWNAFTANDDKYRVPGGPINAPFYSPPTRLRGFITNERSIISSIYTHMALDAADVTIKHVRQDENGRYLSDMDSGLNDCLNLEANIDQAARQFRQDIYATLFEEGVIAIVPTDTSINPRLGSFDIKTMRVGKVLQWAPEDVYVDLFRESTGQREQLWLPKRTVAVVENPHYAIMNEPNSTLQRLIRKLSFLDAIDEQSSSGKLDMIIQLPYVIKSEQRRQQAEQRRKDIEFQLKGSQYGIAYTDGTEKITQLNRPAENNLMSQIEYLTTQLYGQLGLTTGVLDGSADEATMLNYQNRTVNPVVQAAVEAMKRTFLTKTARSQKQSMMFFRDPFKLVPVGSIAKIADSLSRNEIVSPNELRSAIGLPPDQAAKSDQLQNSNIPQAGGGTDPTVSENAPVSDSSGDNSVMSSAFDDIDAAIDSAFSGLGLDEEEPDDSASE